MTTTLHPSTVDFDVPRRPRLTLLPGGRRSEPVQLTLDLEWEVAPGIPAIPPVPSHLSVIGSGTDADLPDIGRWSARIARAVAEVSAGERPLAQLTRWVSRPELAKLGRKHAEATRRPAIRNSGAAPRTRMVRSVRVCPVAPGVVESCAVLVGADRAHAVAMRFEVTDGRWLATAIELG